MSEKQFWNSTTTIPEEESRPINGSGKDSEEVSRRKNLSIFGEVRIDPDTIRQWKGELI